VDVVLNLTVNKYNLLHTGCRIELPREINMKRAVNVWSMNNACFAWSMIAALHPAKKHTERKLSYPHYSTVLDLTGIQFLITLSQIKRFESLNNISMFTSLRSKKKFFHYGLSIERGANTSISCTYRIHVTIIQGILHGSRIYLALWDRKLQQRRIEYISVIGSYTFKKEKNYKYFQQYFF